jgi:hypothetical protein
MKVPRLPLLLALVVVVALVSTGCMVGIGGSTNDTTNNNNGNCDAGGASNSVSCSSSVSGATGSAAATAPAKQTAPNGTQLGKYTVTLPAGDYVPVGASSPTRSQESTSPSGDLEYNTFSGVTYFAPNIPFSTIAPYKGVPTYSGCSQDLNTQETVSAGQGSTFCLYEDSSGLLVGGIVTYIDQSEINPDSVTVQLTIWSNSS